MSFLQLKMVLSLVLSLNLPASVNRQINPYTYIIIINLDSTIFTALNYIGLINFNSTDMRYVRTR